MSVQLCEVNPYCHFDMALLYALLSEREPWQSISHKGMPSFNEHNRFVVSRPYKAWYKIHVEGLPRCVGAIYVTAANEIGIGVLRSQQGNGYASAAIMQLMRMHAGPFRANINPTNAASIALFEKLGFKLLQVTYAHE